MNNQEFDLATVKHFFEHDYHDRGMMKWQGFYLSDHTAALNQQNQQLNEIYENQSSIKSTRCRFEPDVNDYPSDALVHAWTQLFEVAPLDG